MSYKPGMTNINRDVLDRIRKPLKLSEGAGTEAEAALASERVAARVSTFTSPSGYARGMRAGDKVQIHGSARAALKRGQGALR